MRIPEAKRIVIIDWSMIGDLIMLSPCVNAIREQYPDAHLAILGQPLSISTYKHHSGVNELISYDRSKGDYDLDSFKHTVRQLRAGKFDLAFIFHNSLGSALMAWLGRVRQRIGYRYECRDLLLTRRFKLPEKRQHLIETKADLLRACGISLSSLAEEVHIDEASAKKWLREKLGPNFGRSRPVIAVSIGATKEYKQWSADGLNTFLNRFPVNSADFVFIGAPSERKLYEGVYSYNNTVVDLVGQTTIEELTWVLDRADLFVGPDSGPMHLAIGRKTPVVALFGPTDPARCGPYRYERSVVVRAERICRSCESKSGRNMRQCLHTIDPEESYYAAVGLLAQYCSRWRIDQV
ncbi:glycosyltransferase family 9 protein [bacterium]|nr:glycosyltransferase family 9 protein [bacterium]